MPDKPRPPAAPPAPASPAERDAEAHLREALGMHRLTEGEEFIDDDTFSKIHRAPPPLEEDELLLEEVVTVLPPRGAPTQPPAARRPATPTPQDVADLEARLHCGRDRDEVARAALALARAYASAAGLLVVNRDVIAGLAGDGDGIARRLDGIMIAGEARTLFAGPLQSGRPHRGPGPRRGNDARLLRAMGRVDVREVLIVPIAIRERVVNLLYADNGSSALGDTSAAALVELGACLSRAYERLILERRTESDRG
jgi:hypothetical protein